MPLLLLANTANATAAETRQWACSSLAEDLKTNPNKRIMTQKDNAKRKETIELTRAYQERVRGPCAVYQPGE